MIFQNRKPDTPGPIGIFDSGIGGITVLQVLRRVFPNENFLYVGDTARLPYGTKSPQTIRLYAEQIMQYLHLQGVKAIVIACNTASSQVPESSLKELPIYNTILPGAQAALAVSQSKHIGVIGTKATIESGAYTRAICRLDSRAQVRATASPLLVPLAEEGLDGDPITNLIVYRYVSALFENLDMSMDAAETQDAMLDLPIDTLVLGCTHYPLLRKSFERVCGPRIQLVDSGEAIARAMKLDNEAGLWMSQKQDTEGGAKAKGSVRFCLTDRPQQHVQLVDRVLGKGDYTFEHISL